MRGNKGQALVEFILLLPILLLIMMAIIDFGTIFFKSYQLESSMDDFVRYYEEGKQEMMKGYADEKKILLTFQENDTQTTIIIKQNIKITAPGLTKILGKTYTIENKRTLLKEMEKPS